jgi:hypothetical protein
MKQTPAYKPIDEKPYCCVPACILMILERRGLSFGFTRDKVGYELGLVVPEDYSGLFSKVRTGYKPLAEYGTQVSKAEFSINNFFRENKIRLQETHILLDEIENIKDFIESNIKQSNDIVTCFYNKELYGEGD